MEKLIKLFCNMVAKIAVLTDEPPILPTSRYDTCVSTGVAKSPTSDSTFRRGKPQFSFTIVESV
jgi:hypothetical protein